MVVISSSMILLATATIWASMAIGTNAQILEVNKDMIPTNHPQFGGGRRHRHRRQNTLRSLRHLGGKKGGKKGGSQKECEPRIFDGVQAPMLCDFPVKAIEVDCSPSGNGGSIETDDRVIQWSYMNGAGFTAINMDTDKTYVSPSTTGSISDELSLDQPLIFNLTVIGRAGLGLEVPGTGLGPFPDGPSFVFVDGYVELSVNAATETFNATIIDAEVVNICDELA
mmetsp:Transcript_22507/g.53060  ORF Transcript_22507/g.53060 Transcript_22507/m.53060 type:complete len:225 (+) Transcript_22507:135-809(+)